MLSPVPGQKKPYSCTVCYIFFLSGLWVPAFSFFSKSSRNSGAILFNLKLKTTPCWFLQDTNYLSLDEGASLKGKLEQSPWTCRLIAEQAHLFRFFVFSSLFEVINLGLGKLFLQNSYSLSKAGMLCAWYRQWDRSYMLNHLKTLD